MADRLKMILSSMDEPAPAKQTAKAKAAPSPAQKEQIKIAREKGVYALVETAGQAANAMADIKRHSFVVVDCEGVNLGRNGSLCLVQVATPEKRAYLFDVVDAEKREQMMAAGLRDVLQSTEVVKVLHDCRGDSDALFHNARVSLANVFDTQVAYAVLKRTLEGKVPIPIGLSTLIKKHGMGATHDTKVEMHKLMDEDPLFWERRPLPQKALTYASSDVSLLVEVYKQLRGGLGYEGRMYTMKRSEQYVRMYRDAPEAHERKGDFPSYGFDDWDSEVKRFVTMLKSKGKWFGKPTEAPKSEPATAHAAPAQQESTDTTPKPMDTK
eukprot:m51a1_g831 hypothetical protein (325) ;mRNA; r:734769-736134